MGQLHCTRFIANHSNLTQYFQQFVPRQLLKLIPANELLSRFGPVCRHLSPVANLSAMDRER